MRCGDATTMRCDARVCQVLTFVEEWMAFISTDTSSCWMGFFSRFAVDASDA